MLCDKKKDADDADYFAALFLHELQHVSFLHYAS
jgi:hypothetical protein